MKTNSTFAAVAIAVMTLVATPHQLGAEQPEGTQPKHHIYKLIDIGTFGGLNGGVPTEGTGGPYVNHSGALIGQANTTVPIPPEDVGFVCFPGPTANHTFKWQRGRLSDLGALPPSESNCSTALGINDRDEIAGTSTNGKVDPILNTPEGRAVLWKNGTIINLGTFGGTYSAAASIGDRGQVAGFALNSVPDPYSIFGALFLGSPNSTQTRAFIWQSGRKQDLGTLGGPDAMIFSTGFMNQRGQVVGVSYTNSTPGPTGFPALDPFLWDGTKMIDLGSLGGTFGFGFALNGRGQVVGFSDLEGDVVAHPFFWDRGEMTDIGTFGGSFGEADSLNDAGEVVGGSYFAGDEIQHAFLWKHGSLKDLGVIPGNRCSHAYSINSRGQVVGLSGQCGFGIHAFLWEQGEMVDLNNLVFPKSDVTLVEAWLITDNGEIEIDGLPPGCDNGDVCGHPYLLVPNGECNDECEADTATRQNKLAAAPQIVSGGTPAIRTTSTPRAIERVRAKIRQRLHMAGQSATPSD
jgi:probable HAF family extracellular repeat protein